MNRNNGCSYQNLKEMARCRRTWRNWCLEPALEGKEAKEEEEKEFFVVLSFCTFFLIMHQFELLHRFLRWMAQTTCSAQGQFIWESGRWVTSHSHKTPHEQAVSSQNPMCVTLLCSKTTFFFYIYIIIYICIIYTSRSSPTRKHRLLILSINLWKQLPTITLLQSQW